MNPKQTMFYSDEEIELIKITFGGNPPELWQLRNHLWQLEDKLPKFSKPVLEIIKKAITPQTSADVPLHQQRDMYAPLSTIREGNPEVAYLHILANDIVIRYFKQQLDILSGETVDEVYKLNLKDLTAVQDSGQEMVRYTNMLAYTHIIGKIDGRIGELQTLANPPVVESKEEVEKKLKANSTK